ARGDGLLAGVDQVGVDLVLGRERADAQQAVLRLQPDIDAVRDVVGHHRGQADAKVHVHAVAEFLRGALGHLVTGPGHYLPPSRTVRCSIRFSGFGLWTMRSTKMPARCTWSGSISPVSTTSSTSTMQTLPAMAQAGLKLRAVLRNTRLPAWSAFHALTSDTSATSAVSMT